VNAGVSEEYSASIIRVKEYNFRNSLACICSDKEGDREISSQELYYEYLGDE
jgi:hypothetical protein